MSVFWLRAFGPLVVRNGYRLVLVKPRDKAPAFDGWQQQTLTERQVLQHVQQRRAEWSVGIVTDTTPAVDIDSLDRGLSNRMAAWVAEQYGAAPTRVGRAPKTLMMFRAEQPFTKVASSAWSKAGELDTKGRPVRHRVEILGRGQQFVAFGIHPDTRQPYAWTSEYNPASLDRSELPVLTAEAARAICAKFDEFAEAAGYQTTRRIQLSAAGADDSWDSEITQRVTMSPAEIRSTLFLIPNTGDDAPEYDTWTEIGMAIYHQFDGSAEGHDLFLEWSEQSFKHEPAKFEKSWRSFEIAGKGRTPVTFRTVIKIAGEYKAIDEEARLQKIKQQFRDAKTRAEFTAACQAVRREPFNALVRNAFLPIVQGAYETVYGAKLAIGSARGLVKEEKPDRALPRWLEDWVFDRSTERFVNTATGDEQTDKGFNALFNRHMLTDQERREGKTTPEDLASNAALNLFQMQVVDGTRYAPGESKLFNREGMLYVNRYHERQCAAMPSAWTRENQAYADRFVAHVRHLMPEQRDQEIFLSWLAHIVKTRRRHSWAFVLQGTEKDGKTFFGRMMERVLGTNNVNLIDPQALEREFNGWAENSVLNVIEEIRVAGHSRYAVMDQVKPLITNSRIPIRRMRTDAYQTDNTASYLLLTNHQDALPLTSENSRFYVVQSRWQNQADLAGWMEDHPGYYDDLYDLMEHAGVIRRFLMEYSLHADVAANGRAPMSKGLRHMQEAAETDDAATLREIIEEGTNIRICEDLVLVQEAISEIDRRSGIVVPPERVGRILMRAGFVSLGRVRDGETRTRGWSRHPRLFGRDPGPAASQYLKSGGFV